MPPSPLAHPTPPPPYATVRRGREGGGTMTTPPPLSTAVKACLCSILSPGSPGSWATPAPSAPSPDPAKSGSASWAPPSSPGVSALQEVPSGPLPSAQGTHPSWRGMQTSPPQDSGGREPPSTSILPLLPPPGPWWAGKEPGDPELPTRLRQHGLGAQCSLRGLVPLR